MFALLIAQMYTVFILANVLTGQPIPDGILVGGLAIALVVLYRTKKGKGEEDRRSDESVL